MAYFQDQIAGNHCYGCGPDNPQGLRIKSAWGDGDEALCHFQPEAHHCAATSKFLNGGVIATIIDCHAVCTAIAHAYRRDGRPIGSGAAIWFATAQMDLQYRRPVAVSVPLLLVARVSGEEDKSCTLNVSLHSADKLCVEAQVEAVRVAASWME